MSEVIEDFIRQNPGLTVESDAFSGFLEQDRIRAWVGGDANRRERLRAEFSKTWAIVTATRHAPPSGQQVTVTVAPKPAPASLSADEPAHQLHVMCPACRRADVWRNGAHIACRHCGREYDDMLALVPVKPVGAFAFLFGEGWKGAATAAGIVLLLVGLYVLLRAI